jgi:hypothetical protein
LDETYQTYVNRVVRLTLPATYQTQLQNIQKSPKFEGGKAVSFPGYSIVTPPCSEEASNFTFYSNLETHQNQLLEQLEHGLFIPVPPTSFHLTVADLIWSSGYKEAIQDNPDFDRQLYSCIRESFYHYQQLASRKDTIQWQLMGLVVFTRALAVALVPKNEAAYEEILQLRRSIYQNSNLIALGIEQQYYFTAHITLGYFNEISPHLDRERMATTLSTFNDRWLEAEPQVLTVQEVQLRKFKDMTHFQRESHWPMVQL